MFFHVKLCFPLVSGIQRTHSPCRLAFLERAQHVVTKYETGILHRIYSSKGVWPEYYVVTRLFRHHIAGIRRAFGVEFPATSAKNASIFREGVHDCRTN